MTNGWTLPSWVMNAQTVARNDWPREISTPKKLRSCEAMISRPAPAVKPITTVCEMKLTTVPRRARPSSSMIAPDMNDSVSASCTYSPEPGVASGARVANTNSDTALVGPDTACHDDPHSAATIAGTIARYRPYCGGSPASVANATPCGTTTIALTSPASRSARSVVRFTSGHQCDHGMSRLSSGEFNELFRVSEPSNRAEQRSVPWSSTRLESRNGSKPACARPVSRRLSLAGPAPALTL